MNKISTFDKDLALSRYRELNQAEDELSLQNRWTADAKPIHLRMLEMEQEAMEHGYILTVSCFGSLGQEDAEWCWIREMTPQERTLFRAEGRRAVYDAVRG